MSDYSDLMNLLRIDDRGAKGPAVQSQEKGNARLPGNGERVLAERSGARRVNPLPPGEQKRLVTYPDGTVPEDSLVTAPFSEILPEEITWLWPGRIIKGKLNMLVGHPDSGKSFITIDMAARVSTGSEWPDGGEKAPTGSVIILAAEDGPADTIRPRLDAHGADTSRVHFVRGVKSHTDPRIVRLDIDHEALERKIKELNAGLVVIDPVVSFISDKVKPNDESAVRRLLQPLVDMADRTGAAIVGIMHLNKKPDLEAIQRVGGAMAFVGMVRSVLYVEWNEKRHTFTLSTLKLNVAKKPPALSYCIEDAHPDTGSDVGKLVWSEELLAPGGIETRQVPSELHRAIDLLEEMLPVYGPEVPGRPTAELNARAEAEGISSPTLERARRKRGVISKRVSDAWHLWLPAPDEKEPDGDDGLDGVG